MMAFLPVALAVALIGIRSQLSWRHHRQISVEPSDNPGQPSCASNLGPALGHGVGGLLWQRRRGFGHRLPAFRRCH